MNRCILNMPHDGDEPYVKSKLFIYTHIYLFILHLDFFLSKFNFRTQILLNEFYIFLILYV